MSGPPIPPPLPPLADRLAAAPIFSKLPARLRGQVADRGAVRQLAAEERLLQAGTTNTSLFIVMDGGVDVLLPGVDAPHVRLGPGECAGELSLIDGKPVSADVVAAMPTTILELSQDHVWALIDSSATFARNLLRVLAGRVRHDHAVLAESSGARRHYERLSLVDSLTGLHNRRWFDTMFPLQAARLQQESRPGVLLMVDVDGFKALNDDHGHAVGDQVLTRIGAALAAGLRPGDLLARFGGEEFAALVADIDERTAREVAERLRHLVDTPSTGLPACTVSLGVAAVQVGEAFEGLVRRADAALFRAKQGGRNRVSD
ncbi:MAG: GGDEF domain-containing protein [Vicinamibacterales bacterium]